MTLFAHATVVSDRGPAASELRRIYGLALAITIDPADDTAPIPATDAELVQLIGIALDVIGRVSSIADVDADATQRRLDELGFAARLDLRRAAAAIQSAPAHELVARCDQARRQLLAAVRAIAEACADGDTIALGEVQQAADLEVALEVRALYGTMILGLRRANPPDEQAVLEALRYAASAMAIAISAPAFRRARAADRAVVRGLRDRVLAWARGGRALREGLRILDDIWATAALLRGINRRPELAAHDDAVIAALVREPIDAGWCERARRLLGRDHALDRLLVRLPEEMAAIEVRSRLEELRR